MEKYRNPHGQLKENLFLPLFNTNSFGGPLHNSVGKGTRHFNPLKRITDFSTTGSAGLSTVIMGETNIYPWPVIKSQQPIFSECAL